VPFGLRGRLVECFDLQRTTLIELAVYYYSKVSACFNVVNNIFIILGQLMHLTYFATPLELRSENVSKINENFDFHCKYFRICSHFLYDNSFLELSPGT
jgi:hypothetical protein